MTVVKLDHSNLAQHQASIFKQLRTFRMEGMLCDIVVRSIDGTEHGAHTAVLCAASADLKNMLVGPFLESHQVQQGQPVQIAASDAVVFALLEYIYGGQLQLELEDSLELLRLADAYSFRELAATIRAGLRESLESAPVTTAFKLLQLAQDLHDLKVASEEIIAANFEICIDLVDFLELSAGQLGRILRRDDLRVSREEVVVKGLFNWLKKTTDRSVHLGFLLQHVDLQSLSFGNLTQLQHLSSCMGPAGHDLQREVGDALQIRKKHRAEFQTWSADFWPKRRCLQTMSAELGASSQAPQKVLPVARSMCWHNGAIYCATYTNPSTILRWKPGDTESQAVAGRGARVNGVNDLGSLCKASVSPEGDIFLADWDNYRLLSFRNGSGNVVLSDVDAPSVFCSLSGAVYVLTQAGTAVEKLVSATLQPVISNEHLPEKLQFAATDLFVTKDEVIYLSDYGSSRILRINPGETEPVVVGEAPKKDISELHGLFVTEEEKVYVADCGEGKVWTFSPGDAAWTEVLTCPGWRMPVDVVVQGMSLYVSVDNDRDDEDVSGVYEYLLPPELQLE
eukprot:Skav224526  [mRNA]  locus=scaffold388:447602:449299:+ [translate_table: standard]